MKPEKVVFFDEELENSFNELPDKDPIKKGIIRAIKFIQEDFSCGRNVKKELIPKELIQKYNLTNLWIYDLPNGWRLLYFITSSGEVKIIAAVLDWMNHKDYEKLFKFT